MGFKNHKLSHKTQLHRAFLFSLHFLDFPFEGFFSPTKGNKLFQRLLDRLLVIVVCVLLYSYENQYAWPAGEVQGAHSST